MFYQLELQFLIDILHKFHLQVLMVNPDAPLDQCIDFGLRKHLGLEEDYTKNLSAAIRLVSPNTICRLTDQFSCSYLFLELPDTKEKTILAIGPYLSFQPTRIDLLEQAERIGVMPQHFQHLERYYTIVPILLDEKAVLSPIESFGERIWSGNNSFHLEDLNQELFKSSLILTNENQETNTEKTLQDMQIIETRYTYENELMKAVALGLTHKAEMMFSNVSHLSFEQRFSDPIHNMKYYCIIMNTLMRKAAEHGGVHPLHLDSISSSFARKIETVSSTVAGQNLITEMSSAYCRLVRKHTTKHYSPPVLRATLHIDSNLSEDLCLKTLASIQNINASYLSTLFKKETGQTITDYVNQKRVQLAIRFLNTTKLQIQAIAQHCGFTDVNYFSKVFKKYTNKSPIEFRKTPQIVQDN